MPGWFWEAVPGGDPQQNAETARQIFAGEPGAARDLAVLNAGAAIYAGGVADSLAAGVSAAQDAIDSGAASATPLPLLGYDEAPADVVLDPRASDWSGRGWHEPETEGDATFRWTSEPRAEIRVFVVRPDSYRLTLALMPIAGHARDTLVIAANGRPLVRDGGTAEAWLLPRDALHKGANTLTLDAPTVAAPAPDIPVK